MHAEFTLNSAPNCTGSDKLHNRMVGSVAFYWPVLHAHEAPRLEALSKPLGVSCLPDAPAIAHQPFGDRLENILASCKSPMLILQRNSCWHCQAIGKRLYPELHLGDTGSVFTDPTGIVRLSLSADRCNFKRKGCIELGISPCLGSCLLLMLHQLPILCLLFHHAQVCKQGMVS